MNRGTGQAGLAGEDPVVRALTHILEKAALVNYKQIYTQLEGKSTTYALFSYLCKLLMMYSLSLSLSLILSF